MRVGFANGCFDLFHEGHQHFLSNCRHHCDYLIVAVNSDAWCRAHKGEDRPHDTLKERMFRVRAFAEAAIPFEGREDGLIMEIRPSVVFKGYDHGGASPPATLAIRRVGWKRNQDDDQWDLIPVVRVKHLPGFSTTLAAADIAREKGKG